MYVEKLIGMFVGPGRGPNTTSISNNTVVTLCFIHFLWNRQKQFDFQRESSMKRNAISSLLYVPYRLTINRVFKPGHFS